MEIPETEPSSIDQAIEVAFERTRGQFKIEIEPKQLWTLKAQLVGVLRGWRGDAHPRFVILFVELWAIAQISRIANDEPTLTDKQMRVFLGQSMEFLNCFTHR